MPTGLWLVPLFAGMPPPSWPQKDVAETRDYGADFSRILPPGAVITGLLPAFNPPGLFACKSSDFSGSAVWVRLAGGAVNPSASVTLIVSLKDGQQVSATIGLPVVQAALPAPAAANPAVLSIGGRPITIGARQIQSGAAPRPISIGGEAITIGGRPVTTGAPNA